LGVAAAVKRIAEQERIAVIVEVRLVCRPSAIDIIQIECRTAEVYQCVGIVLLLQAARRIKRQIVIDELAEIGIKGWYSAFLVVLADLGIGSDIAAPSFVRLAMLSASEAPKVAGAKDLKRRPNFPSNNGEWAVDINPRSGSPCFELMKTVPLISPDIRLIFDCATVCREPIRFQNCAHEGPSHRLAS